MLWINWLPLNAYAIIHEIALNIYIDDDGIDWLLILMMMLFIFIHAYKECLMRVMIINFNKYDINNESS